MKTTLEKGKAAGYQKEAQVGVTFALQCVNSVFDFL